MRDKRFILLMILSSITSIVLGSDFVQFPIPKDGKLRIVGRDGVNVSVAPNLLVFKGDSSAQREFNNYTSTHKFPLICDGESGPAGLQGVAGMGVPPGGTDGQLLSKKGLSNYSTHWTNPSSTVSWGNITGAVSDQTDMMNTFEPKNSNIQAHIGNTNNPHATTADQVLPSQTGNSGKVLGTNGTTASWVNSGSGTPGGASKSVQYNNAGILGGFGRYSANPGGGGCLIL